MMMKKKQENKTEQTLGTVHTHTHTHTDALFNGQKIRVAVVVLIAIICCAVVFLTNKNRIIKMPMVLGTIGRNRIGEGTEPGSGAFSLGSNDTVGASIDTSKWDLNKVNIVYDTENTPVPVPKGFTASGAEGEHTVNTGFVIYEGEEEVNDENAWDESCTRNQFVWIPVYDTSRVYEVDENGKKKGKLWEYTSGGRSIVKNSISYEISKEDCEPGIIKIPEYNRPKDTTKQYFERYGMQGYTTEKLLKELEVYFDETMKSIEQYGGFYIGRYETGNISSEQPVVQRMNTTISKQNWYAMYPRMKNISTNENVETSMIWGCLWDETLQWLVDFGSKSYFQLSSAENWGNYYGARFEYINLSGETIVKNRNKAAKIPTGSTERNKVNSIYDLAGNVNESTLEALTYINEANSTYVIAGSRVQRGGNGGNNSITRTDSDVGHRIWGQDLPPTLGHEYVGYRAIMYIK